jgi:hypothetical protein
MTRHWDEVKAVVEALSYIIKDTDPPGIEFHFSNSSTYLRSKHISKARKFLDQKTPQGEADITSRLSDILDDYHSKLRQHGISKGSHTLRLSPFKGVHPLSIYILTDGRWGRAAQSKITLLGDDPSPDIKLLVGIEVIVFGEDSKALERLTIFELQLRNELYVMLVLFS